MENKVSDKILGVSKNAEAKTTECADRQFARQYCPDRNPSGIKSEATLKEIGNSYNDLSVGTRLEVYIVDLSRRVQVPALDNNPLARPTIC